MPQHERGLYEPGEDVRVFDGSDEDEDVEGSRLPLLIVLALLVLAMFAGFVWLAYSEGVARGRGETPVITAEAGPARVAPQNAGGTAEPYKGFKIYEQPAPPDDDTAQSAAPAKIPAPPPPATKPALTEPTPAPVKAAAPAAPAPAAPAKVAAAPLKPVPAMKPSQLPAQPAAPIGPATAPPRALSAPAAPVAAKPIPVAPAAAKPVPAATSPAASAPAGSGSFVLQIGAYKSQADANTAWTTYKTKHASLLSGYSPDVRQADLGEKGIWYRLRITGFPSKDVASALCDRLKADGGGCFLGK
jgi:hypothetical protein